MKERIDRHKDGSHQVQEAYRRRHADWILGVIQERRYQDAVGGLFENGKQVGEWITYDAQGKVVKVTKMKS
jgi:hypothetical protein